MILGIMASIVVFGVTVASLWVLIRESDLNPYFTSLSVTTGIAAIIGMMTTSMGMFNMNGWQGVGVAVLAVILGIVTFVVFAIEEDDDYFYPMIACLWNLLMIAITSIVAIFM